LKLAEKGVKVAINYRQNEAAANDTMMRVRERGSQGLSVQADVSRPEDIRRMPHFALRSVLLSHDVWNVTSVVSAGRARDWYTWT